jgi:H+/gluconate symporter-like permease
MELERQEKQRDRSLQRTIFFIGAALSISGLAAATRPRPSAKLLATFVPQPPSLPAAGLWLADIAIHSLIGLAAALVVLLFWWGWGKLRGRARGRSSSSAEPQP